PCQPLKSLPLNSETKPRSGESPRRSWLVATPGAATRAHPATSTIESRLYMVSISQGLIDSPVNSRVGLGPPRTSTPSSAEFGPRSTPFRPRPDPTQGWPQVGILWGTRAGVNPRSERSRRMVQSPVGLGPRRRAPLILPAEPIRRNLVGF